MKHIELNLSLEFPEDQARTAIPLIVADAIKAFAGPDVVLKDLGMSFRVTDRGLRNSWRAAARNLYEHEMLWPWLAGTWRMGKIRIPVLVYTLPGYNCGLKGTRAYNRLLWIDGRDKLRVEDVRRQRFGRCYEPSVALLPHFHIMALAVKEGAAAPIILPIRTTSGFTLDNTEHWNAQITDKRA